MNKIKNLNDRILTWQKKIKKYKRFFRQENLDRLLIFIALFILASGIGLSFFETDLSLLDAMWWSVVTLATVGYGDITPSTFGGRLIAIINMFVGIGLLATFSAKIAALLVGNIMKEYLGMGSYTLENHIIVCGWNSRAAVIMNEFHLDPNTEESLIVLIADIEKKPIDHMDFFFIRGQVSDETLSRANLAKAKTVILMGDDSLDAPTRDAKVILSTLTVESINPETYTIVELVDKAYIRTCQRANANEIIVASELSSMLISQAALNHGITKVIYDLLSSEDGNQLYKISVPASKIGVSFMEVFIYMKQTYQSILLAVQKGIEGEVISNPPSDYLLESGDFLIVVSTSKPVF
ncbi:cag pathogenicity island protein Cag26 [Oscillatoriales cyanobacterium USR001]|nr:cag pathogenicity island protein Cag26 [Oscillatoriales cyanobacterium USR001]